MTLNPTAATTAANLWPLGQHFILIVQSLVASLERVRLLVGSFNPKSWLARGSSWKKPSGWSHQKSAQCPGLRSHSSHLNKTCQKSGSLGVYERGRVYSDCTNALFLRECAISDENSYISFSGTYRNAKVDDLTGEPCWGRKRMP